MKNNSLQKNSSKHDRSDLQESLAVTFIQKLENISLTKTETDSMRENLRAYADLHTTPTLLEISKPILSPFSFAYGTSYIRTYSRAFASLALVILLLVGTTGVTYAAGNTLPGQPLYVVKVSVVEPIQGALITNPVKKAEWQNELTQRRLVEASTLAAENKLSSSTQVYLAQAVTEHVTQSENDSDQLSASGNATAALSVRSELEAGLSAHADFLAFITPELAAAGDATTTGAITSLLATIQTDTQQVRNSRIATEMALSGDASSTPELDQTMHIDASSTISAQASDRTQEEQQIFQASAALFKLLPPLTGSASTSTTTASTTIEASSTAESASTTPKYPFYKLHTTILENSGKL
jgi:hypothetical protein